MAGRPSLSGEAALSEAEAAPDPIEHASPDVELAEAQLAVGRPELAEDEAELGSGLGDEDLAEAADRARGGDGRPATGEPGSGLAPARAGGRLINFARGSWAELQRVQWPDRRQVMQATGVVIGFVIVAGAFLGVSDLLAGKLMDFILK